MSKTMMKRIICLFWKRSWLPLQCSTGEYAR